MNPDTRKRISAVIRELQFILKREDGLKASATKGKDRERAAARKAVATKREKAAQ